MFAIFFCTAITAVFVLKSRFFAGGPYSATLTYRYQTEAFFHGSLHLSQWPYGQQLDWAWHNGLNQPWGLGVPLLRFPFEAIMRPWNAWFPDKLILVMLFFVDALLLHRFFSRTRGPRVGELAVVLVLLSPSIMASIYSGSDVYVEAIVTGVYWSFLILALTLAALEDQAPLWRAAVAVLVAGMAPLFRPPALVYGLTAMAWVFWHYRRKPRAWPWLVAVSAVGPGLTAAGNWIRFGSPFEFGHSLGMTHDLDIVHRTRFGGLYMSGPWLPLLRETFEALWSSQACDNCWRHAHHSCLMNLDHYYGYRLVAWGFGVAAAALTLARRQSKMLPMGFLLAFALVPAAVLIPFYARLFHLASRYCLDLVPAISTGLLLMALVLAGSVQTFKNTLIRAATLMCLLLALTSKINMEQSEPPVIVNPRNYWSERPRTPPVRASYRCGEDTRDADLAYNLDGWNIEGDCSVNEVVDFFLYRAECVAFYYEVVSTVPWYDGYLVPAHLRVRHDTSELVEVGHKTQGPRHIRYFCRDTMGHPIPESGPGSIQAFYAAWVTTEDFKQGIRPWPAVRLLAIEGLTRAQAEARAK